MTAPVTLEQMRTVCATLGLPPEIVKTLTTDASDGVTAVLYVCDGKGRKLAHGDEPLTATIHIPLATKAQEYIGQPEWCCDQAFETLGKAHDANCTQAQ